MVTLRTAAFAGAMAFAGNASAQTFSSFRLVDALQGVTVEELAPLEYRVSLGAAPLLTYQGSSIPITDIFGFWALSEDDDVTGATTDFGVWNAHANNASAGGILGWKTNPNTGIVPGGSQVFIFDSLSTADIEHFGFHIRLDGTFPGTTGNTGFAYVPTPGPAAVLAIAGLVAARRRRR